MKIIAKNRRELYWSVVLFLIAGFIGYTRFNAPPNPVQLMLFAGFRFAALFCLANALADSNRLHSVERVIAVPWFVILTYYCAKTIWQCAHYAPMYPYR
jgi:TctA family transporter